MSHSELFQRIASDLQEQGYSIQPSALAAELSDGLAKTFTERAKEFSGAGLGRGAEFRQQTSIRRDEVLWIGDQTPVESAWLQWCEALRAHLNEALFLGLFSFESHFAHYGPGDFYKRHLDTFREATPSGKPRRKLSLTTYFNKDWQPGDGGELVIYPTVNSDNAITSVAPEHGTVCLFLSEQFPHEVLPSTRERHSIAGWFKTA